MPAASPRRRGPGLRLRITAVAVVIVAAVSALLLWLGWLLVGLVVRGAVPQLPTGSKILVEGVAVDASSLGAVLEQHARTQVLGAGIVAFVLLLTAAAILAWTFTGRALRPLHDVTSTARRLSAESLGERIALDGPNDEVAELADTFDAMLDRLQGAFDSQRRFVANASHELRTPLAVIRTELDVTLSDDKADVEELRRMADVVGTAALRAEQLVEALLLLARTDGIGLAVHEPVDLAAVVASAWRSAGREAAARACKPASPPRRPRPSAIRRCSNASPATCWRTPSGTTSTAAGSRSPRRAIRSGPSSACRPAAS